jgi:hypothetical protein
MLLPSSCCCHHHVAAIIMLLPSSSHCHHHVAAITIMLLLYMLGGIEQHRTILNYCFFHKQWRYARPML